MFYADKKTSLDSSAFQGVTPKNEKPLCFNSVITLFQ